MATLAEKLKTLEAAGEIADSTWRDVLSWSECAWDTVGKQPAGADPIGANIVESYGRFHCSDL